MARTGLSVRWWLAALVAASALPLMLLLLSIYGLQVRREQLEARESALRVARAAAARMRVLHADSFALLQRMTARRAIRHFDGATCDPLFAIVDFYPQYADLLLFDASGRLVCSSEPEGIDRDLSIAIRPWIAAALQSGALPLNEPVLRVIANRSVSLLAAPAGDRASSGRGTLVLVQLPDLSHEVLPDDAVLTILDRAGTVIARTGGSRDWTGTNVRGAAITKAMELRPEGIMEARGIDGVERQFGFSSVPETGWRVYVGIPTATVMAPVRQMFARGAAGAVAIVLIVALAATLFFRAVERPLDALLRAAQAAAAGAHARVESAGPREIASLGEAFNAMLDSRFSAEQRAHDGERNLRALSDRLIQIQEDERSRIARELHDDLGQSLTALKMDVGGLLALTREAAAVAPLHERIIRTLDATVTAVQRISSELRPSILDDLGLIAAIESEGHLFETRTGIECELSLPQELPIDVSRATAIYRIVQEALTNVARHSNATRVEIRLRSRPDEILIEVRDDGRGITEREVNAADSLGLTGIRERADLLGGSVRFEGVPERGTIVSVRIPLTIPA